MTARVAAGALLLYIVGLLVTGWGETMGVFRTPDVVVEFYRLSMLGGVLLVSVGLMIALGWVVVKGPDA